MNFQLKAIEQFFLVELFIILYKVVLTLVYDHSNEGYCADNLRAFIHFPLFSRRNSTFFLSLNRVLSWTCKG